MVARLREHAHRRGPDSRFALWTLRGIDRTVRRVWLAAHRSRHRDYRIWIYSDHGQERVRPWSIVHGEDVSDAIRRVWREVLAHPPEADGEEPPRETALLQPVLQRLIVGQAQRFAVPERVRASLKIQERRQFTAALKRERPREAKHVNRVERDDAQHP